GRVGGWGRARRGTMSGRRAVRVVLVVGALNLVAGLAAAQNGYSFLDAGRSPIDYRVAGVAPRTACRDLQGLSGDGMTVVVAESVPATDAVPAFCRVLGVIQPEIQF